MLRPKGHGDMIVMHLKAGVISYMSADSNHGARIVIFKL